MTPQAICTLLNESDASTAVKSSMRQCLNASHGQDRSGEAAWLNLVPLLKPGINAALKAVAALLDPALREGRNACLAELGNERIAVSKVDATFAA